MTFPSAPWTSIATGSLQNNIFPPKKEIFKSLQKAFDTWHKKNSVPSILLRHTTTLWHNSRSLRNHHLHQHVTHKDIIHFNNLFQGSVFHNEDKRATSLRIYCPCLYFERLGTTFADTKIFRRLDLPPILVVALSEEVWFRSYSSFLQSLDLASRFLRYVDNRLCLVDPSWLYEPSIANFLRPDFYMERL